MKGAIALGLVILALAGRAVSADYKTLRNLEAPAPVALEALPVDTRIQPVKFARVVLHPREGEAWAIAYLSIPIRQEGDNRPTHEFLPWNQGRMEGATESFERAFDEEVKKAGFRADSADSLFASDSGSADLRVAVLVDDIKGRFCMDCPNLLNRKGVGAVVTMNARWEVYSALQGRVVAKVTTTGGGVIATRVQGSVEPAIFAAFRENVRLLLASSEFRRVVLASPSLIQPGPAFSTMTFRPGAPGQRSVMSAADAVTAVFTGDGHGTGFLISPDGYLLTNHHVVGGAKYVKVRWADRSESLGEVIRTDRRRDVALIKVDATARKALALRLGPPDLAESVIAIGTPLDQKLQGTVTKGVVSAARIYDGLPFIQSDVAINGGNSGGPLLDETGAVVGIAVSGYEISGAPVGINLFIPIADALRALSLTPAGAP